MKRCSCCKIEKQTDDFHKSKSQKDGLNNQCKECVHENGKRNAESIKISKRLRYERNKEDIKRKSKIYRTNHPEVEKKRSASENRLNWIAEYRIKNKTKISDRWQQYYAKNRDRINTVKLKWYHDNKKRAALKHRKWAMENKWSVSKRSHDYRARKRNAEGSYSSKELVLFWNFYGRKCLRCDSADDMTIDHVIPLLSGGSNYITNLQPLCRSCNSKKLAVDFRTPEQVSLFNEALERQRVILAQAQAQALIDELFDK